MQSNSVGYVLGFCAAVCLACSVIVSTAAVGLKERQEFNKQLDRQKKVLAVAHLIKEGQEITPKKVSEIFQKRIKSVVVDLQKGKVDPEATKNAATFDQQKAKADPKTSRKTKKNLAGVARVPNKALVYMVSSKEMDAKGKGFVLDQYIFPVEGKGLWSTLYGFVALAPDMNEVKGLTFYQHAETPGLGGEVDNPSWKSKWPGRLIYGPKGTFPQNWKKPKIEVIKGPAGKPKVMPHKVDGLSGATITSKGVTHLLRFWLGPPGFGKFIQNTLMKKGSAAPSTPKKATPPKTPVRRVVTRRVAPRVPTSRPVAPRTRIPASRPATPETPRQRPTAPTTRKAAPAASRPAAPALRRLLPKPPTTRAAVQTTRPATRPQGAR